MDIAAILSNSSIIEFQNEVYNIVSNIKIYSEML